MDFLNGVTVLLIYQLIGEVCARLLNLAVPGPVLGMVLLFVTLLGAKRLKAHFDTYLEPASQALLSHLPLLFIPAGVGVIVHLKRVAEAWLPLLVTLVLSTVVTMVVTALAMTVCGRWMNRARLDAGSDDA
ncbi:MAG: CidA/LrgA family protein [Gammaproteobacteria bacterium]|nr:CidA/LrgA family protein [Gammaproteobacteria bacterium]